MKKGAAKATPLKVYSECLDLESYGTIVLCFLFCGSFQPFHNREDKGC